MRFKIIYYGKEHARLILRNEGLILSDDEISDLLPEGIELVEVTEQDVVVCPTELTQLPRTTMIIRRSSQQSDSA